MSTFDAQTVYQRNSFQQAHVAADRLGEVASLIGQHRSVLDELATAAHYSPDPDLAVLTLLRIAETAVGRGVVAEVVRQSRAEQHQLMVLLGTSKALGEFLFRHPDAWLNRSAPSASVRERMLTSVGAHPESPWPVAECAGEAGMDALRVCYFTELLDIAVADLAQDTPMEAVVSATTRITELVDATLETALALARRMLAADVHELPVQLCRLSIIAMGKCGAQELNYVSDVDVIYVAEPVLGVSETDALEQASALAAGVARVCSASTSEGTLWPVDAGLRPEGKDGPLVRTVGSHVEYYQRWASSWEFQALLKGRPAAGDLELGREYRDALTDMIFTAVQRDGFVADVQAMRQRVERSIPRAELARHVKLGPGGLRDVEFSVQLLQLVHGRTDASVRDPNTLRAIGNLVAGGYIGRQMGEHLARSYQWLRAVEHRLQLQRLRRSHVLPASTADLSKLARAMGYRDQAEFLRAHRAVTREVRDHHQGLFYRPLLNMVSNLSADEARLSPAAAAERLKALGYIDPQAAIAHLTALTAGVSRRASIQRQLLPAFMQWFARSSDPDRGLLSFRRLSDEMGTTHWYLKLLRDSGLAAERLARVLAATHVPADLLHRDPQSVQWLADDEYLRPRADAAIAAELNAATKRAVQHGTDPIMALRGVRRRELLRIYLADVCAVSEVGDSARALSQLNDLVLQAALQVVVDQTANGAVPAARVNVVAMGRYGGCELGYASDLDVFFLHEPNGDVSSSAATAFATKVATSLQKQLRATGPEPAIDLDADLRPEGKRGSIIRSLESTIQYYGTWADGWEYQALLRARHCAGDPAMTQALLASVQPKCYPVNGLAPQHLQQIRRLKVRVESERLPRGVDPRRHLKLGPGGIADIEWAAQLLQMQHGAAHPELQTTGTAEALRAAARHGFLPTESSEELIETWTFLSQLRNAIHLWGGKDADVLPQAHRDLDGVAGLMGFGPTSGQDLETEYLRRTRRARPMVELVLFPSDGP